MHSYGLFEEIQHEEHYRDLEEEPEKAISETEIQEVFEKS